MKLNKMIDHTKLGANVAKADIDKLIAEAIEHDFKSVCVNPNWVKYCKDELKESDVLVCTVIGFPHGSHVGKVKAYETKQAIRDGADEIDMVINVSALKNGEEDVVLREITDVVKAAKRRLVKVIIETCYLTDQEITKASQLATLAGAHFVKTSTGFGTAGATVKHVKLMKKSSGSHMEIKASGGVRTYEDAIKMIEAGATRIGTSNGIAIVTGKPEDKPSDY